jgi:hypothetical protein
VSNDKVPATFHPDGIVPPYLNERIERFNTIKRILREQGLDDNGASPHSWRCENPDRYPGYCTCVNDVAVALLDTLFPLPYEPANPADTDAADLGLPTGLP